MVFLLFQALNTIVCSPSHYKLQCAHDQDLSAPSWGLHPLKGDLKGHWALTVNGNWRMVFAFEEGDAILVDYLDYH